MWSCSRVLRLHFCGQRFYGPIYDINVREKHVLSNLEVRSGPVERISRIGTVCKDGSAVMPDCLEPVASAKSDVAYFMSTLSSSLAS